MAIKKISDLTELLAGHDNYDEYLRECEEYAKCGICGYYARGASIEECEVVMCFGSVCQDCKEASFGLAACSAECAQKAVSSLRDRVRQLQRRAWVAEGSPELAEVS